MPLRVGLRSSVLREVRFLVPRSAGRPRPVPERDCGRPRPPAPLAGGRPPARGSGRPPSRDCGRSAPRPPRASGRPRPPVPRASGRPPDRPRHLGAAVLTARPSRGRHSRCGTAGTPTRRARARTAAAGAGTRLRTSARTRSARLRATLARAAQVGPARRASGRAPRPLVPLPVPRVGARIGGRPGDRADLPCSPPRRSLSRRGLRGGSSTARPVVGGRNDTGGVAAPTRRSRRTVANPTMITEESRRLRGAAAPPLRIRP